jgi:hypothetical protein
LSSRVIKIKGRWAYPAWPDQLDDEGIVSLALAAGLDLLFGYVDQDPGFGSPVMGYALLRSYARRPRSVPLSEIEDFALSWELPPSERDSVDYQVIRRIIRRTIRRALYYLDDLGIFSETDNEITLTAWGDVFVSAWLNEELRAPDDDR